MSELQNAADRAEARDPWMPEIGFSTVEADEARRRYALSIATKVDRRWTAGDIVQSAHQIEQYLKTGCLVQPPRSGPLADDVREVASNARMTQCNLQAGEDRRTLQPRLPCALQQIFTLV